MWVSNADQSGLRWAWSKGAEAPRDREPRLDRHEEPGWPLGKLERRVGILWWQLQPRQDRSPFVLATDQLVSVLSLQQPQPKSISSGGRASPVLNCQRSPLNVVLIHLLTIGDYRDCSAHAHFHSYFFVWWYHFYFFVWFVWCSSVDNKACDTTKFRLVVSHALLSTDERFFLFPAILVAQVLVGAMGNTPPI